MDKVGNVAVRFLIGEKSILAFEVPISDLSVELLKREYVRISRACDKHRSFCLFYNDGLVNSAEISAIKRYFDYRVPEIEFRVDAEEKWSSQDFRTIFLKGKRKISEVQGACDSEREAKRAKL